MYEYIIQWGLKSLTKASIESGKYQQNVMIEAIKTKNALVIERFKIAEQATNDLVKLTIKIEKDLKKFQRKYSNDSKKRKFIDDLGKEFHPVYYREYRKIRPRFDITNDLLSGYTIGLTKWVHFSNIKSLCKNCDCVSPSSISRIYRMVWTFLLSTITRHLRLSTNDLRFWLTDKPYSKTAHQWMQEYEYPALCNFFTNGLRDTHFPILEDAKKLEKFWKDAGQ